MAAWSQTSRINPYWLLVAPAVLLVLVLYVAPILNVLMLSVTDPKPGLGNYAKIIESDTVANLILRTLKLCVITTLAAVSLGYVVAYAMLHALSHVRQRMLSILMISFWISVLVRCSTCLTPSRRCIRPALPNCRPKASFVSSS